MTLKQLIEAVQRSWRIVFITDHSYDEWVEGEDEAYKMMTVYKVKEEDVKDWIDEDEERENIWSALEDEDYYDNRIVKQFMKSLKNESVPSKTQRVKITFIDDMPQEKNDIIFLYPEVEDES